MNKMQTLYVKALGCTPQIRAPKGYVVRSRLITPMRCSPIDHRPSLHPAFGRRF